MLLETIPKSDLLLYYFEDLIKFYMTYNEEDFHDEDIVKRLSVCGNILATIIYEK